MELEVMCGNLAVPGEKRYKELEGRDWDFAWTGALRLSMGRIQLDPGVWSWRRRRSALTVLDWLAKWRSVWSPPIRYSRNRVKKISISRCSVHNYSTFVHFCQETWNWPLRPSIAPPLFFWIYRSSRLTIALLHAWPIRPWRMWLSFRSPSHNGDGTLPLKWSRMMNSLGCQEHI